METNNEKHGWFYRRIPRFIRVDFGRKFATLLLSVLVYFSVLDRIGSEREIHDVPVKVQVPESLVLQSVKPDRITVRVRGSEGFIQGLSGNDLAVLLKVDPSNIDKSYSYSIPLTPKSVSTPFGAKVIALSQYDVHVELDRLVPKNVALKPIFDTESKLPDGYAVSKVTLNPQEITVTAPSAMIENISELQTKPIPLGGITQNFTYTADVSVPNKSFIVTPSKTLVQVEVIKERESRIFSAVPVRVLNSVSGEKNLPIEILSAPSVEITVSGPKGVVEMMRKDDLKPYIDVSQINKPGIYKVNVNCWSDRDNVSVKSIYPETISVKLEESGKK